MRFKISIVFLILILVLLFVLPSSCSKEKNNIVFKQRNYMVYYNEVNDENIYRISEYDMAILEPTHVTKEQLRDLRKSNTLTYGYQSIFEVESYNKEKIDLLSEEDYLYNDGIKQFNEQYQCYYGDIKSENYRDVLLASIEKNIIDKGFDGVFFDTLDDIEHLIDERFRKDLHAGYIEFFKMLKIKYPRLSIIQNRGFNLYNLGSSKYLDALMFEDLEHKKIRTSDYYINLVEVISNTAKDNRVAILALSHEDALKNYELAKELNWLYYFTSPDNNYLKFEQGMYNIDLK